MTNYLEDGKPVNRAEEEWKSAAITVAGTDADVNIRTKTGFTTLFDTVKRAHEIKVHVTADTHIRLNSTTTDKILVTSTSPYESDKVIVEALYVSTGGASSTVTVELH